MQDVDNAGAERGHQEVDARGGKDEPSRRRLCSEKRMYCILQFSFQCSG